MTYRCRICSQEIAPFMSFGRMPIANAFLRSEGDFTHEYFYELAPALCPSCKCFQIVNIPAPDQMFHDHYAYFASTSRVMTEHFRAMSDDLCTRYLGGADPFVVEIGSNDGITLSNFSRRGMRHLGVEPSANVAEAARAKGVQTLCAFFNVDTAGHIVAEHGQADLFIATNTMHHIEDTNAVAAGVARLLKPTGVMIQEDPYLGDMVADCAYDQIYAEHMYIWSITALDNAFGRHGMEVFHVEHNHHHGGCMRYHLGHKGAHPLSPELVAAKAREGELGLDRPETYDTFRIRCEQSRDALMGLLEGFRAEGKTVVGYGATAKSATVINWCGITPDHVSFIQDTTPAKQGTFSPGAHIPVVGPERFAAAKPDVAVLFAWNHFAEIDAKERAWRDGGGKWVMPVRQVEVR
ncbi:MAG: methyltransferase domain-containing protein [Actinomycetota bacterium]